MTTLPEEGSARLKETILKEKLAACVLELQSDSMYWWKGKIERDRESLLIFKTTEELEEALVSRIKELHPYDVPFIAKLAVEENSEYGRWLREVLAGVE